MNRSALPIRFIGHIRSNSLFQVRSPRCTVRNFPNVMTLPTDCAFSVGSLSFGLWLAQDGLAPPAPGNAVLIASPADVTMRQSRPLTETVSPGFAIVRFALP